MQCNNARGSYYLGKRIRTGKWWALEKVEVMLHLLGVKFQQCEEFRLELKKCLHKILVEDTPNQFWGRGKNAKGINTLGVLMLEGHLIKLSSQIFIWLW